jgi:pilus assembly protein CpaF
MIEIQIIGMDGDNEIVVFEGDKCRIGSGWRADLTLKGKNVGKSHAVIERTEEGLRLSDLGTMTGTWLNSERIVQHGPLRPDDRIVVGDYQLCVIDKQSLVEIVEPKKETSTSVANEPVTDTSLDDTRFDAQLVHWRTVVHEKVLEQMDLRRRDIHNMSDLELRQETEKLLDTILSETRSELPGELDVARLRKDVLDEAVGLGPIQSFLDDENVTEIMINARDEIFVEKKGRLNLADCCFTSDQAVLKVIERIITPLGRRIDEASPMVDARLKDGSRVNAIIPPLAIKGPSITIRKFSKKRLLFNDLVEYGSLNEDMVRFLEVCVQRRRNIIVSGGTGSGKTTLLNVLSNLIPKDERIITVEDAAELQLNQPNLVSLESRPSNVEGRGEVAIRDLVRNALRMRPDRIVVGECRGAEAIDMLQAMNTGHEGSMTTAHANTPRDVLSRLEVMVMMAGMDLPAAAIREQICSAIDVIVQQKRFPCGARKITHITEVTGIESGTIQLQNVFSFKQNGLDAEARVRGEFVPTGFIPSFYEDLADAGFVADISIFGKKEQVA